MGQVGVAGERGGEQLAPLVRRRTAGLEPSRIMQAVQAEATEVA